MNDIRHFENRILWGDCLRVMKRIPSASVDLVLTDPPYIVNYTARDGRRVANDDNSRWLKPAFAEVYRLLKPDCFAICFYGWNQAEKFLDGWKAAGFTPVGHFIWVKRYASKTGFTEARHEQAYLLAKGHPARPRHPPKDVLYTWRYMSLITTS
jgi:site-specific DNA-methyltransferase (adenine-specific)